MKLARFGALALLGHVCELLAGANAALFPAGGPVRTLDAKDFDGALQDGVRERAARRMPRMCGVLTIAGLFHVLVLCVQRTLCASCNRLRR